MAQAAIYTAICCVCLVSTSNPKESFVFSTMQDALSCIYKGFSLSARSWMITSGGPIETVQAGRSLLVQAWQALTDQLTGASCVYDTSWPATVTARKLCVCVWIQSFQKYQLILRHTGINCSGTTWISLGPASAAEPTVYLCQSTNCYIDALCTQAAQFTYLLESCGSFSIWACWMSPLSISCKLVHYKKAVPTKLDNAPAAGHLSWGDGICALAEYHFPWIAVNGKPTFLHKEARVVSWHGSLDGMMAGTVNILTQLSGSSSTGPAHGSTRGG